MRVRLILLGTRLTDPVAAAAPAKAAARRTGPAAATRGRQCWVREETSSGRPRQGVLSLYGGGGAVTLSLLCRFDAVSYGEIVAAASVFPSLPL
jgi:hypothetical protein